MGESLHTLQINPGCILATSKEIIVDVNEYKTQYMVRYLQQNGGRNKYVRTDDRSFERVDEL
jgi:hypothetical protein